MAGRGGIQRYTANLVRALTDVLGAQNVRCLAVSNTSGRGARDRFSVGVKLRFAGRAFWQGAYWKPDLIIGTHIAVGPIGSLLSRIGGSQHMIVVHGIEAWGPLSRLKKIALSRADEVIVTGHFSEKQLVKKHQIDPQRVRRLPCMWDDTLFGIESETDGVLRSVPEGHRVVLTVARMEASERYKGHDAVLHSLRTIVGTVPNLTYVIVGDGDDRPRLEKLAAELGLQQYVVFAGEVGDGELAALYRRSDVFVLPARTVLDEEEPKGEGFGIVFLEAMAFGKPVLGPNCGAPSELIRHGENGLLVNPDEVTSVAEALLTLLSNPDMARAMGEAGRNWVRRHYSYSSFRARLRDTLVA
jgi:glycosyltransferase involved in cell wall biosynthesis